MLNLLANGGINRIHSQFFITVRFGQEQNIAAVIVHRGTESLFVRARRRSCGGVTATPHSRQKRAQEGALTPRGTDLLVTLSSSGDARSPCPLAGLAVDGVSRVVGLGGLPARPLSDVLLLLGVRRRLEKPPVVFDIVLVQRGGDSVDRVPRGGVVPAVPNERLHLQTVSAVGRVSLSRGILSPSTTAEDPCEGARPLFKHVWNKCGVNQSDKMRRKRGKYL